MQKREVMQSTFTQNSTAASLAGVAVLQGIASLRSKTSFSLKANAIGSTVCVIALMHYNWMRNASDSEKIDLRYGDWFITCPLLVWELCVITEIKTFQTTLFLVIGSVLMILLGRLSLFSKGMVRASLFGVSSLILIGMATTFVNYSRKNKEFVAWFFLLWSLYPIAYVINSNSMFDVLDLFSKAGFGTGVAAISFHS